MGNVKCCEKKPKNKKKKISKMSSLYRTARLRFALYSSDGLGRDRYISYNNGGFWDTNEYKISPKPNYEYPKYKNFHTLFHMAAPFKYIIQMVLDCYVLRDPGLRREQKPLTSYHLSDFLRNDSVDKHSGKNLFLSKLERINLGSYMKEE